MGIKQIGIPKRQLDQSYWNSQLFLVTWNVTITNPCIFPYTPNYRSQWMCCILMSYNTDTECVCVCAHFMGPQNHLRGWRATPRSKQQQLKGHVRMKPLTQRIFSHTCNESKKRWHNCCKYISHIYRTQSSLLTRAQPHSIPAFTQSLSFHLSTHYSRTASLRLSGVKGLHVCMFNILELQESSLK